MWEEDEATHYEDAHTGEGRRRLSVCARDLYRLVDRFRGTTAAQLEEYRLLERLLERLLREQCHVGKHRDGRPGDDDDDAGECKVPVALKDPKQVSAVEAIALAFAPMAHLRVVGRGDPVPAHPFLHRAGPSSRRSTSCSSNCPSNSIASKILWRWELSAGNLPWA